MKVAEIISQILIKRGISPEQQAHFLSPPPPSDIKLKNIGVEPQEIKKAVSLIKNHSQNNQPIVIYGDYDADGITATAILWESLFKNKINTLPFIPNRTDHGYGLSIPGINEIINKHNPKLIITVDNGITAFEATKYAQQKNINIIIIDHHQLDRKKHPADSIIHSTKVAGSGLTWIFTKELENKLNFKSTVEQSLELAAIGTVADMVSLIGSNRSIVKHGLESLKKTNRAGIKQLLKVAEINPRTLEAYHLGFQIAPRINSMGRLESALDSLRLLCTSNTARAKDLAQILNQTNSQRQNMMEQMIKAALVMAQNQQKQNAVIICHEQFHEGIIGLIASQISKILWRPTIVLSQKKQFSKASARSIPGFDVIAAIRKFDNLLEGSGGHPMAAGFTIQNDKISQFTKKFINHAKNNVPPKLLLKRLDTDLELEFQYASLELVNELKQLAPFGIGNPQPLFRTTDINVISTRAVGQNEKHLQLLLNQNDITLPAIAFGKGNLATKLMPNSKIDIAYHLDMNIFNNQTNLQLKIKDIQESQ